MIFLYILAAYVGTGILFVLFRFYIYFKNPQHLYDCHMYDARTRGNMEKLFKDCPSVNKSDLLFKVSVLLGCVFPPIAIIMLVMDINNFCSTFIPYKAADPDEKSN